MSFQEFLPQEPSGSTSFTLTTNEAFREAFDLIGIGTDGEELDGDDFDRARNQANLVLRYLQGQGIHLNTFQTGTLFLTQNQESYVLDTDRSTNNYTRTQLGADIVSPTTSVTVVSTDGLISTTRR